MWKISEEELEKLKGFLETSGKKFLFYHADADGICSAALFLKFFDGFEAKPREGPMMRNEFADQIIKERPVLIVFLDLPVDQEWKKIVRIKKGIRGVRIVVIDHHIFEKNLNSERILHINPKFQSDVYLPVSYIMYRVLERMGKGLKGMEWISCMGVIGDYAFKSCRGFLDKCRNEDVDKGVNLISSAVTFKGSKGAGRVLEILVESKGIKKFIKIKELKVWKRKVNKEIRRIMDAFERGKEVYQDAGLIVFEIKSKLNLASVISTILSEKYENDVIIIRKKSKAGWKVSVRCQSGAVNLNSLMKKCAGPGDSAGGHVKAAGGVIRDWTGFKKRVIKELSG